MKKSYTSPQLLPSGDVVRRTQSGSSSGSELAQPMVKFTA